MLEVKNVEVLGLARAIKASGNPMTLGEVDTRVDLDLLSAQEKDDFLKKDLARSTKLGSADRGSGHDNFLSGIVVQFDVKYPQYWSMEFQRYHFAQIVSSQSKMHRLCLAATKDEFDGMFNKYVDREMIDRVRSYVDAYNACPAHGDWQGYDKHYWFMKALSNLPMGYEMWMTVTTNYLQLRTIYAQRKNHKLREDWGAFCKMIEELPRFKELCGLDAFKNTALPR